MMLLIVDSAAIGNGLGLLSRAVGSLRPFLKDAGEIMLRSTRKRFAAQISPDGKAWAPLHPWTLLTKRRSTILAETGALKGSINWQVSGEDTLEIGTNLPYAKIHQFGGVIVPVKKKWLTIPWSKGAAGRRAPTIDGLKFHVSKGAKAAWLSKDQKKKSLLYYILVKKVTIPARPYLGFGPGDKENILATLASYLGKAIK